jgi:hypothetical protein
MYYKCGKPLGRSDRQKGLELLRIEKNVHVSLVVYHKFLEGWKLSKRNRNLRIWELSLFTKLSLGSIGGWLWIDGKSLLDKGLFWVENSQKWTLFKKVIFCHKLPFKKLSNLEGFVIVERVLLYFCLPTIIFTSVRWVNRLPWYTNGYITV